MKIITDVRCTEYDEPGHPESPGRISGTVARLKSQSELPLTWLPPGAITDEALLRAHSPDHLARLQEPQDFDADTPFLPHISDFARNSAAAALTALRCAREGEAAFSLMRPPGHHATRTRAMGFCYLSNMAIAVLEALATGSKKVAVFDFDVHHGNGTEAILINQEGATFHSIHQHPCYPGSGTRNLGSNCFNFPLPPHTPRQEYRDTFQSALENLKEFKPDLIGVSAGFDCYARDPLAQETLEAEDFYWLGKELFKLGIPAFSLLEGGYSHDLPSLVLAYLLGLAGK